MNSPQQLYNFDETFLPLDFTQEKAVTMKNRPKEPLIIRTTVLCAASAVGLIHHLP